MAPSHRWTTTVKLALPLLVVAIIAAAPSISGAVQLEHDAAVEVAEAGTLAKAGRSRFLSSFDGSPVGRRLLNANFCAGPGTSDNCKKYLPKANNPQCCADAFGVRACWDVGAFLSIHCGSCSTKCTFPNVCCSGVCINPFGNDSKNCGRCGKECPKNAPCMKGMCGYNGKY